MADTLFIALLAIIFVDARRLPQLARQVGRALVELRRAKNDFVTQLRAIEPTSGEGQFGKTFTAPRMNEETGNG
jgi:Sec-independent protein translocase protein TatA